MGGIASIFKKPKLPDTSRQDSLLAEREKKISMQEEEAKRKRLASSAARQRRARSSLITGAETGVRGEGRTTLG